MTARDAIAALAVLGAFAFWSTVEAGIDDQALRCFSLLDKGKVEEALTLTENTLAQALKAGEQDDARRAEVLRLVARASTYAQRADPRLADAIRADVARLDSTIALVDVPFLKACLKAAPAPAAPYLRRALSRARAKARIKAIKLESYLAAMAIPDATVRREATAALARRLAQARRKVERGGQMNDKERRLCSSRLVISSLIDQLAREQGTLAERLPAEPLALDAGIGRASHALTLIETPALAALEAARSAGEPRAASVLETIRIAIGRRQRRFPKSTWASASR